MKRVTFYTILVSVVFCASNCTYTPVSVNTSGTGSVEVIVWINNPQTNSRETRWNRLVVQVFAKDMDTLRDTFSVDMQNSLNSFMMEKISAGENRSIEAWTLDSAGDTIHGKAGTIKTIEPGQTTKVSFTLNPVKGSLYLQLTNFPASVDSVLFAFETTGRIWKAKQKKASKVYMNLDKIPYGSIGTLSIIGYSAARDTVTSWIKQSFKFENANTTVQVSFVNVGKIGMDVSIVIPGVTTIIGTMDTTDSLGDEKGGLLISEIMYAADDSEYVEIYNPSSGIFTDTIFLQKDNDSYRYFFVTIPSHGFYVIGRRDSVAWFNAFPSSKTALDLSSGSGNWITLRAKDSSIIDIVPFLSGTNAQGWPSFSGKKSIVLDTLVSDPEYNNYGKHWTPAKSLIDSTKSLLYGTPGKVGV